MNTRTLDEPRRGPGRPRKDETRKDLAEGEQRRRRTDRKGVLGYRLQVAEEKLQLDRYKYGWFNDDDARIFSVNKQDDWDFVHQDGTEIKENAQMGSAINVVVGTKADGSPKRAYLMRKRKDWYEEDQRQNREKIEEMMNEMRRGNDPDGSHFSDPSGYGATYVNPENRL